MTKTAIYPGSFDPFTNGHLSIVKRGLEVFGKIKIVVAYNQYKQGFFTVEERTTMIKEVTKNLENVSVDSFSGLLVDYVHSQNTNVILRGLRAGSDFDYEFNIALMNRVLGPKIQSVFLMTDYNWLYVSSSSVKEAASLGGDISGLVHPVVMEYLSAKFPLLKQKLLNKDI